MGAHLEEQGFQVQVAAFARLYSLLSGVIILNMILKQTRNVARQKQGQVPGGSCGCDSKFDRLYGVNDNLSDVEQKGPVSCELRVP